MLPSESPWMVKRGREGPVNTLRSRILNAMLLGIAGFARYSDRA